MNNPDLFLNQRCLYLLTYLLTRFDYFVCFFTVFFVCTFSYPPIGFNILNGSFYHSTLFSYDEKSKK